MLTTIGAQSKRRWMIPQADWSKAVVATLNQGVIEFSDGSNSCKASKNDLMQR
jgi:hypothetical protein